MDSSSPYHLLYHSLLLIPLHHYLLLLLSVISILLYRFFEIHFVYDLLHALRGDPITLTYNESSKVFEYVASRSSVFKGRFLPTPWLASPHLQTLFLSFFNWSPDVEYKRELFKCSDGGTLALDWVLSSDVKQPGDLSNSSEDLKYVIVVIIPGLTSDSASAYVKHLALKLSKEGCNVVVANHRGLGGLAITSDQFYNAGWTEDTDTIIKHIHNHHPNALLFAVGTSLGANILVKYLAQSGTSTPLLGAASICCPWDLVQCDRFINRNLPQRLYNRALAFGLYGYAKWHHSVLSRLVDWNSIQKARSVRDFDDCATRVLGNFETVDCYYRESSTVSCIGKVTVPLLCISALDDPICTREAIPYDECRANPNVLLATTTHGGHVAFYEGLRANQLWWVRATCAFLLALLDSPLAQSTKDGDVADAAKICRDVADGTPDGASDDEAAEDSKSLGDVADDRVSLGDVANRKIIVGGILRRHGGLSVWLLAYIAVVTSWPLLGYALRLVFKRKLRTK